MFVSFEALSPEAVTRTWDALEGKFYEIWDEDESLLLTLMAEYGLGSSPVVVMDLLRSRTPAENLAEFRGRNPRFDLRLGAIESADAETVTRRLLSLLLAEEAVA
jgi:hypothetical protein